MKEQLVVPSQLTWAWTNQFTTTEAIRTSHLCTEFSTPPVEKLYGLVLSDWQKLSEIYVSCSDSPPDLAVFNAANGNRNWQIVEGTFEFYPQQPRIEIVRDIQIKAYKINYATWYCSEWHTVVLNRDHLSRIQDRHPITHEVTHAIKKVERDTIRVVPGDVATFGGIDEKQRTELSEFMAFLGLPDRFRRVFSTYQ